MAQITEFLKLKVAQILQWMLIMCRPQRLRHLHMPEQWPCNAHAGVTGVLCTPGTHMRVAGRFIRLTRFKSPPPLPSLSFSSYSHPWSNSSSGDLIGSESGVHITGRDILLPVMEEEKVVVKCHRQKRVHVAKKRDIPPCISILPDYIGILPTIFEDQELANGDYLEAIRKNGSLNLNRVTVYKWFEGKSGDDHVEDEIEEEPTFIMD